ncbi:uncharacterized protein LOC112595324 [Melanaphis sacchari]|uniref:uncharacterized protein LOC112595324 n=1 Tax=Melanaphis sacchari TaxID=742174 RepID=UPI000DC15969|nr:uncharacterized protein LOC112595324 [Melanaphis sacchari]XP_025196263.1 uncharacterized protein LOC112595324 [Melanaphis sacchari]
MDFYNKHFHRLIRSVDPNGMLNVPFNVFTDEKCLQRYFKTNNDFRKLDVPWMCDQLIILLLNFEDVVAISSTLTFLRNDFQRIKYPFVLISQAYIGLILIHTNATKAYFSYCTNSTKTFYKKKIAVDKIPRKKQKRKSGATKESDNIEQIQSQKIQSLNQHRVSNLETIHNEIDILLNHPRHTLNATEMKLLESNVPNQIALNVPILHNQNMLNLNTEENIGDIYKISDLDQQVIFIQPIEEFSLINQYAPTEHPLLPKNDFIQELMSFDVQPKNIVPQQEIEQSQRMINLQDQQTKGELSQHSIDLQEQQLKYKGTNEHFTPENLTNQSLKRKRPNVLLKKKLKKRQIEQNSRVLRNRLKKLQGEMFDRPLECMMLKCTNQSIDHLPIRYAMYRNRLIIPFAALTLNMELEEHKNLDDIFNNEMTMGSYKTNEEKLNDCNTSNICIYNHCKNNSLPHLTLLPLVEECLTNNSLVWRDTINEINNNLEDSLREISPISKIDQTKWKKFKDKLNYRVNQSLVAHKTLVGPELSRIDIPQPLMAFPSFSEVEKLLNGKTMIEPHNSTEGPPLNTENICPMPSLSLITKSGLPQLLPPEKSMIDNIELNINQENDVMNHFGPKNLQNIQNIVEQVEEFHRPSIDIKKIISNILKQFPKNCLRLMFTDVCPIHVTNRRYAISVLVEILGLHKNGILKLTQPCKATNPSSISIEIINHNFFEYPF